MEQTIALVVAAGRGSRFGGSGPKQYEALGGIALLRHALLRLSRHPRVQAVRGVIHPDDRARYDAAAEGLALLEPVEGGATRQESVCRGLESLADLAPARVLIHDGARPFPSAALVDRLLDALDQSPGAVPGLPVADTLKRVDAGGAVGSGPLRDGLWRVQTPQAFHYSAILQAHRAADGGEETDDAAVAERAGLPVLLVRGEEENLKVTDRKDLERAHALLAPVLETRVGTGFDVHRFGPGAQVTLCGVALPHDRGLRGHSDADVGLHALTDAILGALGEADIGHHFPPSDPRWRGADSAAFLAHAGALTAARGGMIRHLDVTLICERPKVGPHRGAMRERIAAILGLDLRRVSVKATTTEGLGFTGRGEGIAAQAVATLALPAEER